MNIRRNFLLLTFLLLSAIMLHAQKHPGRPEIEKDTIPEQDSIEYELIVIDPGYETFLATQKPASFFTQVYYETWNYRYVIEWNMRHDNPIAYGDMYETKIDYDPKTDYGLDLNYRLYYYFRFFEEKNGISLVAGHH